MEPKIINQEILLFTGASFSSRSFSKRSMEGGWDNYTCMEELEKVCWDGMLHEMLPELFDNSQQRSNNYVWNTASGVNFLSVNMSRHPMPMEKQTSVDPYFFLHAAGKTN